MRLMRNLLAMFKAALLRPNPKQKEAYGRVFHNLAVASFVGFVTFGYSGQIRKAAMLLLASMILFVVGGILSKGE